MFIRPCEGRITSGFGPRIHPITGAKGAIHQGVDYGNTPIDNRILAAADGKVSRIQKDGTFGTYGNLVMIVHNIGGKTYETVYAHLASINVSVGQLVKCGQVIGIKGTTGGSTGVHLHFEVHAGRWNNKYNNAVNPLHYVVDPDVKVLQSLLVKAGYRLPVDGIAGPATDAALRTFQKIKGLVVDGSAGPATMAALQKAKPIVVAQYRPQEKEDIRMFNPSSGTLKNAVVDKIETATKDKTLTDTKWLDQVKAGNLSLDDALALSVYIDGKRQVTVK